MSDLSYYDQSYPPSLFTPPAPPPNATGATAGTPGTFTPPASTLPLNAAQATSWGITATPATAWTTGQYVVGTAVAPNGNMQWNGTAWVTGIAAAVEAESEPEPPTDEPSPSEPPAGS